MWKFTLTTESDIYEVKIENRRKLLDTKKYPSRLVINHIHDLGNCIGVYNGMFIYIPSEAGMCHNNRYVCIN